jgi:SAM-dependent methyltransferase
VPDNNGVVSMIKIKNILKKTKNPSLKLMRLIFRNIPDLNLVSAYYAFRILQKRPPTNCEWEQFIDARWKNISLNDFLERTFPWFSPKEELQPVEDNSPQKDTPRQMRPDSYREISCINGPLRSVFLAEKDEDYDWLDKMIHHFHYYENSHNWGFGIDTDKRGVASLIAGFQPQRFLEIGCSDGAVMQCLLELGITGEGIDVSEASVQRAIPNIKKKIFVGDLLEYPFKYSYDFIFALDLLEHLNPNKLSRYLARISDLLSDGGYIFVRVPVWGKDDIFGTVFPIAPNGYVDPFREWFEDYESNRCFRVIPVDQEGFPLMGHLCWAGTRWWLDNFTKAGFQRKTEIEVIIHSKFDWFYNVTSVARRSFYILSKNSDPARNIAVLESLSKPELVSVVYR